MRKQNAGKLAGVAALSALLLVGGCVTNPETGQRQISKAGAGALIGAGSGLLLGTIIGGRPDRSAAIVGAGIGAIAGAGIGHYMDQQEKKLRQQTAGTGIEVDRQGNDLLLRMPANVTFDFNSAVVRPDFRPQLEKVADTLKEFPSTFVDVMGHTDNVGTRAANMQVSQARADAVAQILISDGVQRERLAARGYGFDDPVASNDTEAGRAENRRVEIRLSPVTNQDVGPGANRGS